FIIHSKLEEVLKKYDREKKIDAVAVVEVLNKNFPLADRTVLQNIYKTPWLAKPNFTHTDWEFASIPYHGKAMDDPKIIARKFFDLICKEIVEYTKGKKALGLLLSGGMDSRMVAGAIDYLIQSNKIDIEVTALTWGNKNS